MLLAAGDIAAGEMFSFVLYSGFIGGSIGGLSGVYTRIQKFIGATEDLFKIYDETGEEITSLDNIEKENQLAGEIELRDLLFSYPSRKEDVVLNNINLKIKPNQMVALVGPSGAGKTTIASLLLGLYAPTDGRILFDGKQNTDIPLSHLRHQISLVPQDIFLFGGSIRENIAYGKPNAPDNEIMNAAKMANALEFIEQLPKKFDTVVGERGTQLSGGQRQRIAIARAILKNPKILILDEATSSLDAESEKLVQEALEKLMQGRTSIVIAHRLSTVRKADQIFVLENGQIKEQGTHDELVNMPQGLYKTLSQLQFAG
jgi:ABC-type multidrug transport system fused ATPase/permease subunit